MKQYIFEKQVMRVLNTKVWNCTLEGDVTTANAANFKNQLHDLVNSWNTEVKLTIADSARLDLSSLNALVTGYRKATVLGNSLSIRVKNNPHLTKMLEQTKFDKILLN